MEFDCKERGNKFKKKKQETKINEIPSKLLLQGSRGRMRTPCAEASGPQDMENQALLRKGPTETEEMYKNTIAAQRDHTDEETKKEIFGHLVEEDLATRENNVHEDVCICEEELRHGSKKHQMEDEETQRR